MASAHQSAGAEHYGWFTPVRIVKFLVAWLSLYVAMTFFVANPYWDESSASAAINWQHTMFLHGFLIGLVGLVAIGVVDAFHFRSYHARSWILVGTMVATVFAGVGGIFDAGPTDTLALWTQILGFFSLDEILLLLSWSFLAEYRQGHPGRQTLAFWVAWMGSISMFLAAVMGHLAGWLLEFGQTSPFNWPSNYAHFIGVPFATWTTNLITSHSHEMVIALIGTLIGTLAWHYGYQGNPQTRVPSATKAGLAMVVFGIIAMTVIYLVAGFTINQPPTLFAFGPGGIDGLAGDDLVTGIFVLVGGLVALSGFLFQRQGISPSTYRVRLATIVAFTLSVVTVVGAGYSIELRETYFGMGNPEAAGAARDAVFTFWHQDFAFFMIPALIALLYLADRYLLPRIAERFANTILVGLPLAFLGGLIYVFWSPARYGVGYLVITLGFVTVAYAIIRLWWSALNSHVTEDREPLSGPPTSAQRP
jgi:hypothetical protein